MTQITPEKVPGFLRPNLSIGMPALLAKADVVSAAFGPVLGFVVIIFAMTCSTAVTLVVVGLPVAKALGYIAH